MNHMLALQALEQVRHVPAPGVFKVFGFKVPTLAGQVLHWIAHYGSLGFKWIVITLSLALLWKRGKVELWKIGVILAIGWIAMPSLSPRTAHYTSDITHGSAVGTTGASTGLFFFLLGILVLVFYRMVIKPPVVKEEEIENQ